MRTRTLSILLVGVTTPLFAMPLAPPASAASPRCGSYPPGQSFQLRINPPSTVVVHRGTVVTLSTRLVRGGKPCAGQRVGFYLRGSHQSRYVLTQNTNPVTDRNGLRSIQVRVTDDLRFFTNYGNADRVYARSSTVLVQVRP
jgi:hypothetical protein